MADFCHLHVHTEYSLLDGLSHVDALLQRAKELGMEALAITDHGAMYAAVNFYLAAREMGIKPIIGCEVYLAPASRFDRRPKVDASPYHLILLATNMAGYRNLLQLSTLSHLEGFYYKPRVDKALLEQHSEGLIALSACPSGEVPRHILLGDPEGARQAAAWYHRVYGPGNFYLELQEHGIPEFATVNRELRAIGREMDIPLVATNDVHYTNPQDSQTQEILLCIQTNTTIEDPKRMRMAGTGYHLRSGDEMAQLFPQVPEAISNSLGIAERCNLRLAFDRLLLPRFEVPEGQTHDNYLEELCYEGLRRRYREITPAVEERLRHELSVIRETRFAEYILIVWDLARHARQEKILFGPRGSAAGSIVCYCLGISDVEPISNKLLFERFLNVERKEMPDIDMDFADDRRDEMIDYAVKKYGRDHVAQIITFGTLGAKAAIRDVGRALGMPYGEADKVARLVPSLPVGITIDGAMKENRQLQQLYETDPTAKRLIDTAKSIEGVARHASTHAAGVVISRDPLVRNVPLQPAGRGNAVMTQYPMDAVAKIGLLKMDFLGLANLTILGRAVEIIQQTQGVDMDLRQLPLDDEKVFAMLSAGETTGVFQLEGAGMRRYIKELKPTSLDDLAAMVALYRPGPMAHIPLYIQRKHGQAPVEYPHPAAMPILEDTYGIIVYQDQVLQLVQAVAGYSLAQADLLRKAMGKKVAEIMAKERSRFVAGAQERGLTPEQAEHIFDFIEPFAGYAFNRAHACCYAMVAYQTAYMKANYPVEYMAAVLNAGIGNTDKIATAVVECRRLGIEVLPPDINRSEAGFVVESRGEQPAIRFGLAAVKNVGAGAIGAMVQARREAGAFSSVDDFCRRVDLRGANKRVWESLIKVGALDSLGRRSQLLAVLDQMIGFGQREQRAAEIGQGNLFDLLGSAEALTAIFLPGIPDTARKDQLSWEKELLGLYLSEHPLQRVAARLQDTVTVLCGQVSEELAGQKITVAGMVNAVRPLMTKKREAMVAVTLEDLHGSVEVVVFPRVYERTHELWQPDRVLVVQGRVDIRNERPQIVCDTVADYPLPTDGEAARPLGDGESETAMSGGLQPQHGISLPAGEEGSGMRDNGQRTAEQEPSLAPAEPSPSVPPPPYQRLHVTLTRSNDQERDIALLQQVDSLLQAARGGPYPVALDITIGGEQGRVELERPGLTVRYDERLARNLAKLLGPNAVKLEPDGSIL